jgi:O-antigen/teichoic acid export membrane protein
MRKRLIQGIGANFLGQIINLASRVLLVPLFLTAWGARVYGEWLLLSSIVAYLSLTDLGGQLYIINRLTQAYAQHDIPLFRKILHTGLGLFLVLPLAVFLIFVGVILFFPPGYLLQITVTSPTVVFLVLSILAFQLVFSLPQGILMGVYRSVGLLPRGVMLGNLMQGLIILFVAAGLLLRCGMLTIVILQVLPALIITLIALWDLNRIFPQFNVLSLQEADFSFGLSFVNPSFYFMLIQIAQACSIQGMVVIVGIVLGSVQVVVFATLRTVVYSVRQVLGLLAQSAWPEMTRLDAERNNDKLALLFRGILRTTLVATTCLVIVFHFWGGTIYHAWLGDRVAYSQTLMDLFLLYLVLLLVWNSCGNLLMAVNQHYAYSLVVFASSLLTIGLAYLGGLRYGLSGVVVALIIGDGLVPLCLVPYLLYRYQERFSWNFFLREVAPAVVALGAMALLPGLIPAVLALLAVWWWQCLPWRRLARPRGG